MYYAIADRLEHLKANAGLLRKYCHADGCRTPTVCPLDCECRNTALDLDTAIAWILADAIDDFIKMFKKTDYLVNKIPFEKIYAISFYLCRVLDCHYDKYRILFNIVTEVRTLLVEIDNLIINEKRVAYLKSKGGN